MFDSVLPIVDLLSKLESVLSNPAAALSTKFMSYYKSFVVISVVFITSSPSRFYLKKSLSWDFLVVQWLTLFSQCREHGFDPWSGN